VCAKIKKKNNSEAKRLTELRLAVTELSHAVQPG